MKYTIRKDCNTYCHQLSHGPSDACDDNLRGPGCVCKDDMVMDNKGVCMHKSSCPCQDMEDNSVAHPPGHVLDLTCKKW